MRIGIDTGGTFTDTVLLDGDRSILLKTPSTPNDPSLAAVELLPEKSTGASVVHGTTVATNALLTRSGAKVTFIATQGCRDLLHLARQTRQELYNLNPSRPAPLVGRDLCFEVSERLDWQGQVVEQLSAESVHAVVQQIQANGAESAAVCLLFSFLNPTHERQIGQALQAAGIPFCLSSDVAPESREFERASTTAANAFVLRVMSSYLERLENRLHERGVLSARVMQSNGGAMSLEEARQWPIRTALSGPAGGVIAATKLAENLGIQSAVAFDMGGTSADVCWIEGQPRTVRHAEIGGLPLRTPMLDIHTVGAGGGSIARVDSGGGIRVGPQSAGADPGPVAYGLGEKLTVTDANLALGRLPAVCRLAGSMVLDLDRVHNHFEDFAGRIPRSIAEAAQEVAEVVETGMARAIQRITLDAGRNPKDSSLIAFGGAGGLHACRLAERCGMSRVIIPPFTGAFSALGLALADVCREYAQSVFAPITPEGGKEVQCQVNDLRIRARAAMRDEGIPNAAISSFVEMRYVGQSYSLRVPFRGSLERAARAFHRAHRSVHGYSDPAEPVEVVAVTLIARGSDQDTPEWHWQAPSENSAGQSLHSTRLWDRGAWHIAPILYRGDVREQVGPAVVVQPDATTYVPPGWVVRSIDCGALEIVRAG